MKTCWIARYKADDLFDEEAADIYIYDTKEEAQGRVDILNSVENTQSVGHVDEWSVQPIMHVERGEEWDAYNVYKELINDG